MKRVPKACADGISLKEITNVKAELVIYSSTEKRDKAPGCPPFRKAFQNLIGGKQANLASNEQNWGNNDRARTSVSMQVIKTRQ